MLRHPGDCLTTPPGEGCSRTATDLSPSVTITAWNNPAGRGSVMVTDGDKSAVP
jgi:hypothetical protein